MKINCHPPYLIYCSFFLYILVGISGQALAENHKIQIASHKNDKVCLTGWLPLQQSLNSSCLQIISCFNENGRTDNDKEILSEATEATCPEDLHQAMMTDPAVTAMVDIKTGNKTYSKYISASSSQDSSSWFYGWSAAHFGMSMLHIFKAAQKAKLLLNGKTSHKNIYFFASYMIGAFHHIFEMPVASVTHTISWGPHLIMHTGMLILSIIERLRDCSCCSQFKNGHNTMIAFHAAVLALAALW